jgi:hypothetical protein
VVSTAAFLPGTKKIRMKLTGGESAGTFTCRLDN